MGQLLLQVQLYNYDHLVVTSPKASESLPEDPARTFQQRISAFVKGLEFRVLGLGSTKRSIALTYECS